MYIQNFNPQNHKILIVDDVENVRNYFCETLCELGYAVDLAQNGKEALLKAGDNIPDLILLDIKMPDITGINVLSQLKRYPKTENIPVIIISAVADETDIIVQCIKKGAEDQLLKNVDPLILHEKIKSCIQKKQLLAQQAVLFQNQQAQLKKVAHSNKLINEMLTSIGIINKIRSTENFIQDTGKTLIDNIGESMTLLDQLVLEIPENKGILQRIKATLTTILHNDSQNFDRIFQQINNINLCIKNVSNILNDVPLEKNKFKSKIFQPPNKGRGKK